MTRDTLFAFQNLDHQVFGISSQSGCMSVVFLFACMGRGRYVSRYKTYTGDGQASKKRRSLRTSLENQPGVEEVTPAELLPCGISFSLSSFGLVFSPFYSNPLAISISSTISTASYTMPSQCGFFSAGLCTSSRRRSRQLERPPWRPFMRRMNSADASASPAS